MRLYKYKMKHELLSGKKITLREMQPHDIDLIHNWENRPELRYLGDIHQPLTKDEVTDFYG